MGKKSTRAVKHRTTRTTTCNQLLFDQVVVPVQPRARTTMIVGSKRRDETVSWSSASLLPFVLVLTVKICFALLMLFNLWLLLLPLSVLFVIAGLLVLVLFVL